MTTRLDLLPDVLPEDLLRRVYRHYLRARSRHLWSAVRKFIQRMNILRQLTVMTWDPESEPGDSPSSIGYKFDMLNMPWCHSRHFKMPMAYNIRSRRGVKRPLEDFL